MVNTIVHHAFPTRLELLFAFEFTGNNQNKGTYFIRIVVIFQLSTVLHALMFVIVYFSVFRKQSEHMELFTNVLFLRVN